MPQPPARETELLNKISAAFPSVKWNSYWYTDEGWDHEVIILDNKLVFRFPNDPYYIDRLQNEIKILTYLKDRVSLPIPDYQYVAPDKSFAGYPMLPGRPLTKADFDALQLDERQKLAEQLAGFISAMHAQDISQPVFSGLREDPKTLDKQVLKSLKGLLNSEDLKVVDSMISEVNDMIAEQQSEIFIHNDLYHRHLLRDSNSRKLSVIDFSDMCLGDPAVDFGDWHDYGLDFVKQVYDLYTGPKDDDFLERAWIYQKGVAVYMFIDYFESHKTSFEVARQTFDRVKAQDLSR